MGQMQAALIDPAGELTEPQNPFVAMETLNKRDGFEVTEIDHQIAATHGMQLAGHFLIGREGIVRWLQIETAERTGTSPSSRATRRSWPRPARSEPTGDMADPPMDFPPQI
jgi:hypothetical protein